MKACPQIAKKERFATAAKTLPALQNLSNRIFKIHKYIKTDIKIYFRVFSTKFLFQNGLLFQTAAASGKKQVC